MGILEIFYFFRHPQEYIISYRELGEFLIPMLYKQHGEQLVREDLNRLPTNAFQNNAAETTTVLQSETLLGTDNAMHWQCLEYNLSMVQIEQIHGFSFWIEGVSQFTLGAIGILLNLLAIPVLCRMRINSIFNKLLICLLILHTVYISCILLIQSMWPAWDDDPQNISETWFILSFSYVLRPLQKTMRYSSTFFTTLMARQRCLAIKHPIEYRNSTLTINHWVYVIKSLILVLLAAIAFTFPLYLETSVENTEVGKVHELNNTHFKYVSKTTSYFYEK